MIESSIDIKNLPMFSEISAEEKDELLQAGRSRVVEKGKTLFMHGDELKLFYIVADGAIRKIRETPDGKEITVGLAMRGDIIGGSHIFTPTKTYQWGAMAAEDSVLIEYPVSWFKEKVKQSSNLALNMLAALSQHTQHAAIDAEHLVTFSAPQRLACFLMRLCALYDYKPQDFKLPFSKNTIASKLGMEPETFSRSLNKLKDCGINVTGMQVSIKDLHAVECYVCGHCSISEDCATINILHKGDECHSNAKAVL